MPVSSVGRFSRPLAGLAAVAHATVAVWLRDWPRMAPGSLSQFGWVALGCQLGCLGSSLWRSPSQEARWGFSRHSSKTEQAPVSKCSLNSCLLVDISRTSLEPVGEGLGQGMLLEAQERAGRL